MLWYRLRIIFLDNMLDSSLRLNLTYWKIKRKMEELKINLILGKNDANY